jgi:hypothetical protein
MQEAAWGGFKAVYRNPGDELLGRIAKGDRIKHEEENVNPNFDEQYISELTDEERELWQPIVGTPLTEGHYTQFKKAIPPDYYGDRDLDDPDVAYEAYQ